MQPVQRLRRRHLHPRRVLRFMVLARRRRVLCSGRRALILPPVLLTIVTSALLATSVAGVLHASHVVAFWVGLCALVVTVMCEVGGRGDQIGRGRVWVGMRSVALFLGVAASLVGTILLIIRLLQIGIEVVQHYPTRLMEAIPFSLSGVWALVFVFAACGLRVVLGRDDRLVVPLFWLAVLSVGWVCASPEAIATNSTGGFERTSVTVLLLVGLSAVLVVAVLVGAIVAYRRRWRLAFENPDSLADTPQSVSGFSLSCICVALMVGFLVVFHLVVPVRTAGSYRVTLLVTSICALGVSVSCFLVCGRAWSSGLGDAGFALLTLAVAASATMLVPSQSGALVDRYPQLFNAMIVGFAIATGWWTWLSQVWDQQLDDGAAWTTAGRLIPHAKRFAFFSAALAYLSATLMAFWPRLPGIATMDHSYGRIVSGFSANLFLLLVMLWASRRLRRITFHFLTLLVVMSGAGFMVVRMLPFASDAQ
jgi:hypothetical protein